MNEPFFVVGCPRSGTTLLRDLLRRHPNLTCPEETHFFRWPFVFAGADYSRIQNNNPTLAEHRKMDGVPDKKFHEMLEQAQNRKQLQDAYCSYHQKLMKGNKRRWFDKTPQNAYGLLLLSAFYPEAKFIHLHRHPFNVVTSLMAGKVMAPHSLLAAINSWLESIMMIREYRKNSPHRVFELGYEELTANPHHALDQLLSFVGEPTGTIPIGSGDIYPEQNKYHQALSEGDIDLINDMLGPLMRAYGYE